MNKEICIIQISINADTACERQMEEVESDELPDPSWEEFQELFNKYSEDFLSMIKDIPFVSEGSNQKIFYGLDPYGSGLGNYLKGEDNPDEVAVLSTKIDTLFGSIPEAKQEMFREILMTCLSFENSQDGPTFEEMEDELILLSERAGCMVVAWFWMDGFVTGQGWDNGERDTGYLEAINNDEDVEEYCIDDIDGATSRLAAIK